MFPLDDLLRDLLSQSSTPLCRLDTVQQLLSRALPEEELFAGPSKSSKNARAVSHRF